MIHSTVENADTTDGQLHLVPSDGRGVSSTSSPSKQSSLATRVTVRIEFDGGTSCNIPRLGYGNGYGSYKIDNEPMFRCFFNRPMSANAAELLTLIYAIGAIIDRGFNTKEIELSLIGDSQIALNWALKLFASGKTKMSKNASPEFRDAIFQLKEVIACFGNIRAEWQSRLKSVATFGH